MQAPLEEQLVGEGLLHIKEGVADERPHPQLGHMREVLTEEQQGLLPLVASGGNEAPVQRQRRRHVAENQQLVAEALTRRVAVVRVPDEARLDSPRPREQ